MNFADYFPIWKQLTPTQQQLLSDASVGRQVKKGEVLHRGSLDCLGLLLVVSGQLRAYSSSEDGREITLYRLFEHDIYLFSASCMMQSIQFEIIIEAEKDCEVRIIAPNVYKKVMSESAPLANYTNEIMASRFSEVMWLIEQIMWKSFDKRLAAFLTEESAIEQSALLKITHEKIANHLGTAREVVTRMLRYFQNEGFLRLSRGTIEIVEPDKLAQLAGI